MKIQITMKDPDGVYEALTRAYEGALEGVLHSTRFRQVFPFGEYITVEYDTDTGHAEVVYHN